MQYILRKLFITTVTLFLISVLTFTAFHIIPGDPALLFLGTEASPQQIEKLHEDLGMNRPLTAQYVSWITGMMHGDCGFSLKYKKPVDELLKTRIPLTLIMGFMAAAVVLAAGIPLGMTAAHKKDSVIGKAVNVFSMITISIPEFFLSILVIWGFGLTLHLFSPGRYVSYHDDIGKFLRFMIFPVCTVALPQIAILTKYVRAAVLVEQEKMYVRTAESKGCMMQRILIVHILRNALVAVMPLIGMMAGNIFTGSIIVEQIFGIQGIGRLLISSVSSRDFPLTQAIVLYTAVIIVTANLLVDIAVQMLDPRIRLKD